MADHDSESEKLEGVIKAVEIETLEEIIKMIGGLNEPCPSPMCGLRIVHVQPLLKMIYENYDIPEERIREWLHQGYYEHLRPRL